MRRQTELSIPQQPIKGIVSGRACGGGDEADDPFSSASHNFNVFSASSYSYWQLPS